MKHTFAICAYGQSEYLETCIRSLMAQNCSRDQIQSHGQEQILNCAGDEGSSTIIMCTSTPSEFLSTLAETYGIPLYVREGESGLQADWNFAVRMAVEHTGAEVVTLAHQDDVYLPGYADTLAKALDHWPDMSLFCTRYRTIGPEGTPVPGLAENVKRILRLPLRWRGLSGQSLSDRRFIKRLVLRFGNSICCPSCSYVLSRTGQPVFQNDYRFVIDWDTLLRLADQPGRFVCVEQELMEYRVHPGAETSKNIQNHRRELEEEQIFLKLWPAWLAHILMHFYKKAYKAYE